MSLAIGMQAVSTATSIATGIIGIRDNIKAAAGVGKEFAAAKASEITLMQRRMAERSLELAGAEAKIQATLGTVIEGRSLDVASNNVAQAGGRATADDVFVTNNAITSLERQQAGKLAQLSRDNVNTLLSIAGDAVNFAAKTGEITAATNTIRKSNLGANVKDIKEEAFTFKTSDFQDFSVRTDSGFMLQNEKDREVLSFSF